MNTQQVTQSDFERATYSAEDNKLRLYPACRLDDATYERVKVAGFRWAPKQELFVAPRWTPAREDLCIEFCQDIEPEETTLAERAEVKATRLDELSIKRERDANSYFNAAEQISQRFEGGQPILVGHHSERKARKDQQRMESAQDKGIKASALAEYWRYRATGVERHANRKHDPRTRANRVKTLLADLRKYQRRLNFANRALDFWLKIEAIEDVESRNKSISYYAGAYHKDGAFSPSNTYTLLRDGNLTHDEALQNSIEYCREVTQSDYLTRSIQHTLGRLGYERSEQGEVSRFEGEITAAILQTFAREQGADKPKAVTIDGVWRVESRAPLPIHISRASSILMVDDKWRDLMQGCGHVPVAKKDKPKQPKLLNYRIESFPRKQRYTLNIDEHELLKQVEMTKAEYMAIYKDHRGTQISLDGSHKIRIAFISAGKGTFSGNWCTVFLTDSKAHPV